MNVQEIREKYFNIYVGNLTLAFSDELLQYAFTNQTNFTALIMSIVNEVTGKDLYKCEVIYFKLKTTIEAEKGEIV